MGRAPPPSSPPLPLGDDPKRDLAPGPMPRIPGDATLVRDAVTAMQDVFAPTVDFSTPCAHLVPRPPHLEGRKVQGHKRDNLWCNRPRNHPGPHRVYSADFQVLAEVDG